MTIWRTGLRSGCRAPSPNSYAQDIRGFLPLFAVVLELALPEETEVERKGGLFQKAEAGPQSDASHWGNDVHLEDTGHGPLAAQRIKTVRGIRLKTEPMPVELWLAELSDAISSRAQRNEKAFFALKELLG